MQNPRGMTGDRPRILVIDDEPLMLSALRRSLREEYEVVGLDDADQALAVLTSGEWFDAVLCDIQIPGTGGPEIRDVLRKIGSPLAARFIWMSGGACPVEGPF